MISFAHTNFKFLFRESLLISTRLVQIFLKWDQQHPDLTCVPPFPFLLGCSFIPPADPPPGAPIESGIIIWFDDSLFIPILTISINASLTYTPSLADVSKYCMSLFSLHQASAFYLDTFLSFSLSTLFPIRTKGKVLGSSGPAFSIKPSFHLSSASKLAGLVKSKQSAQQSAPL